MPPSIKRLFSGISNYVQKDLLSLLRTNEPVSSSDATVQADEILSHTQAFFPAYVPTPEDELILANWEDNQSADDLNMMVTQIYGFDKTYMYSDMASTLRYGDEISKKLNAQIAAVQDPELRTLLARNMWGDDRTELVARFPWLATRHQSTPYTRLVTAGEAPENAKVWIGAINGLRSLMARIYVASNAVGELMVWANDYDRAKYYARFRKDDVFHGIALPADIYAEVDRLADYIDSRGFKKALVMGRSDYSVVRRELEQGDCVYTVYRADTPMISFFFANKQA